MKMRYLVFLFTLSILIIMLISIHSIDETNLKMENMVILNEKYKAVEDSLKDNASREGIEQRYGCKIILVDDNYYESEKRNALTEGNILFDYVIDNQIAGKIIFGRSKENIDSLKRKLLYQFVLAVSIILFSIYGVLLFIYKNYIKPFRKMKDFAVKVASGNLEVPLHMRKRNYFGAFTESFDLMREALKDAREKEYQSNISKKELIASLSHDIKTPISTIKATCEVLLLKKMDADMLEKIDIVLLKTDMINQLMNNMFQATLEELEKLTVNPQEELSTILEPMFNQENYYEKIHIQNKVPNCLIYVDKLRLNQVIDNVINNAYKYAKTDISVSFTKESNGISIKIRDYGPGVDDEQLPLVVNKYFRGNNVGKEPGSGLGLYIASTLVNMMKGEFVCYNDNGFHVIIHLKKV